MSSFHDDISKIQLSSGESYPKLLQIIDPENNSAFFYDLSAVESIIVDTYQRGEGADRKTLFTINMGFISGAERCFEIETDETLTTKREVLFDILRRWKANRGL